jgi:hypothetical protein
MHENRSLTRMRRPPARDEGEAERLEVLDDLKPVEVLTGVVELPSRRTRVSGA